MSRPARRPSSWDRIMASRHRRSILGSLAVLVLLVVVVIAGLVGGGTPAPAPTPGPSAVAA